MRARVVLTAIAVAIGGACASSGSAPASRPAGTSRNPDLISETEISQRAGDAATALAIIEKLRPQMLRGRGTTSTREDLNSEDMLPRVYVDEVSYGAINSLGNLLSVQVKEIRFIKGPDATTRWGTGHMAGVILVTTKK